MDESIEQEKRDSVLFKEPLCKYCQVKYLEANKNVTFDEYSKEEAADILYTHNYINVISPFKHNFACRDSDGNPVKLEGKHYYPNPVKFSEYVQCYFNERDAYPQIFQNIMDLESHLNAIISNEVMIHYNIISFEKFEEFIDDLKKNINNSSDKQSAKSHMIDEVNLFPEKLIRYKNIYVFMDRLSFSELITIYRMCDPNLKNRIFKELDNRNYTFNYRNVGVFEDFLRYVIQIRNYVCHSNSLETLINYYKVETKTFRKNQSKKTLRKIIAILSTPTKGS